MKIFSSTNNIHVIKFINAGDIRFGPEFYKIELDGEKINNRVFSASPIWSDDDRYLAIQEWETRMESNGPNMKLCIIDFELKRQFMGMPIHGYTAPKHFEDHLLIYEKRDWSKGYEIITTIELNINTIKTWKKIYLPNKKSN